MKIKRKGVIENIILLLILAIVMAVIFMILP